MKNSETGAVAEDPKRISTNVNVPRAEVPTVVSKIIDATECDDERQLEIMQVLRHDTRYDGAPTQRQRRRRSTAVPESNASHPRPFPSPRALQIPQHRQSLLLFVLRQQRRQIHFPIVFGSRMTLSSSSLGDTTAFDDARAQGFGEAGKECCFLS